MTDTSQVSVPDEMSEVDMMLSALGDIAHPNGGTSVESEEPSAPTEEPGDATPPEEPEPSEETPPPPTASLTPPGYIDFEGQQLPVADVRAFLELNERLRSDPAVAERVTQALKPPVEEPKLPEWIDPEDQTTVQMWRHLQSVEQKANAFSAQAQQAAERDQRAKVVDGFRAGVASFKARYPHLSEDQVAQIAQATGRANIVDGLERTEGSISAAFDKGLEMMLWSDPKLRSLAQPEASTTVPPKDRKTKQSALSGSGGSTPQTKRPDTKPKTREELMSRMLDDIRSDPDLH
jgi:hypothetical protein